MALPGESTRCRSGLHRAFYLARVRGALQGGGDELRGPVRELPARLRQFVCRAGREAELLREEARPSFAVLAKVIAGRAGSSGESRRVMEDQGAGQGVGGQPGTGFQREKAPRGSGVGPENGRWTGARRTGEIAGGMGGKPLVPEEQGSGLPLAQTGCRPRSGSGKGLP